MRSEHADCWIPGAHDANVRAAAAMVAAAPSQAAFDAHGEAQEGERPLWVKSFDVLSVGALLVLLALAVRQLAGAAAGGGPWALALAPALVLAVLCADLVSGLVHWLCDRFFAESTPVLGAMLIKPFREHHRDPLAITRHGFFELCGNNALAVIVPVALLRLGEGPQANARAFFVHAFVIFLALAVFATNQVHKWAHAKETVRPVRWLQAYGVILSPHRHARHHRGDFSNGYCVTTGWLNPALDALRVLPRCERALRRAMSRAHDGRSSQPS